MPGGGVVPGLVRPQPGVRVSVRDGEARQVLGGCEDLPGPEHLHPGAVIAHPGTLTFLTRHSPASWGPEQQQPGDVEHGDVEISNTNIVQVPLYYLTIRV